MTLRTSINGPKWAGLRSLLNQAAQATNTTLTIEDEDKGFIYTTIFFRVDGTKEQIREYENLIVVAVKNYNE